MSWIDWLFRKPHDARPVPAAKSPPPPPAEMFTHAIHLEAPPAKPKAWRVRKAIADWIAEHDLAGEGLSCQILFGATSGVILVTFLGRQSPHGITIGIPECYELFPDDQVAGYVRGPIESAYHAARRGPRDATA